MPAAADDRLIVVARVLRPQGRHGELRLEPLTDDPGRLRELTVCYLVPPPGGECYQVEGVRYQQGVPVLKLRGVDGLAAAEPLGGRLVTIPRAAVRPLPPGWYYPFELEGCEVRTSDGAPLGRLTDVLAGVEHDFWVVRVGGRECLVPAVAAILERVDLARRVVVIRPPEGLLELGEPAA